MWKDMKVSTAGMEAHGAWMKVIANNLANVRTVKTPEGGPYQRQTVMFEQAFDEYGASSVKVSNVIQERRAPEMRYEPGHPMANAQGMVAYPSIDLAQEMSELMAASKAYEANAVVLSNTKEMMRRALEI